MASSAQEDPKTEVQLPDDRPYQVLPPLSDEEYDSLEADILKNGILEPVTVDEDGVPIDGYNRTEIGLKHGLDIPFKVVSDLSEREKRDLAYRLNLNRRHMEHGQKQEIIRQYLLEDWDGDNTDAWYDEVANTLGVGGSTVRKVFSELKKDGELVTHNIFPKEEKRQMVREYHEANPDASNRDIAKGVEFDVDHKTVGNWLDEFEEQDEEEAKSEDEEERAARIVAANFEHPHADNQFIAQEADCNPKEADAVLGRLRLGTLDESVKERARELVRDESETEDSAPEMEGGESEEESTEPEADGDGAESRTTDGQDTTSTSSPTDPQTDAVADESGADGDGGDTIESEADAGLLDVPMNDWSVGKLRNGEKSATTRTERYGNPGDRFEAADTVYELTHVVEVPLHVVAGYFYEPEGCKTKGEFIEVWEEIHPRKGYEPDWMVYLHLFRGVDA